MPPSKKFKSARDILKEYYLKHQFLNEQDLDELVTKTNMSYEQVREWFAEVQRRLDMGLDPFMGPTARTGRDDKAEDNEEEARGEGSAAADEQAGGGMGEEDDEDEDEEDDGEETDDSEVWEPSRSVRKSLSVSED